MGSVSSRLAATVTWATAWVNASAAENAGRRRHRRQGRVLLHRHGQQREAARTAGERPPASRLSRRPPACRAGTARCPPGAARRPARCRRRRPRRHLHPGRHLVVEARQPQRRRRCPPRGAVRRAPAPEAASAVPAPPRSPLRPGRHARPGTSRVTAFRCLGTSRTGRQASGAPARQYARSLGRGEQSASVGPIRDRRGSALECGSYHGRMELSRSSQSSRLWTLGTTRVFRWSGPPPGCRPAVDGHGRTRGRGVDDGQSSTPYPDVVHVEVGSAPQSPCEMSTRSTAVSTAWVLTVRERRARFVHKVVPMLCTKRV